MTYEEFLTTPVIVNDACYFINGDAAIDFIVDTIESIVLHTETTLEQAIEKMATTYRFVKAKQVPKPHFTAGDLEEWLSEKFEYYDYEHVEPVAIFRADSVKPHVDAINEIIQKECEWLLETTKERIGEDDLLAIIRKCWEAHERSRES